MCCAMVTANRRVPCGADRVGRAGRVVTSPRMKEGATAAEAALAARPPPRSSCCAVVVSSAFLGFMLSATDGHFVPQVVDLYLVFQYARAMAEGHPFQYDAGEPPSTGATSLLHTAVLALAHAAGIRGEGLAAFAIADGRRPAVRQRGAGLPRSARASAAARDGALAGALVALGGPVELGVPLRSGHRALHGARPVAARAHRRGVDHGPRSPGSPSAACSPSAGPRDC